MRWEDQEGAVMEQLAIFSGTLGLAPPWYVTSVRFAKDSNRLEIKVEYAAVLPFTCPICGTEAFPAAEPLRETWYHENFFNYATHLHALVPRMACCGGTLPRPWCRTGSRFHEVMQPPAPDYESPQSQPDRPYPLVVNR
jgi:hypothetical protein